MNASEKARRGKNSLSLQRLARQKRCVPHKTFWTTHLLDSRRSPESIARLFRRNSLLLRCANTRMFRRVRASDTATSTTLPQRRSEMSAPRCSEAIANMTKLGVNSPACRRGDCRRKASDNPGKPLSARRFCAACAADGTELCAPFGATPSEVVAQNGPEVFGVCWGPTLKRDPQQVDQASESPSGRPNT